MVSSYISDQWTTPTLIVEVLIANLMKAQLQYRLMDRCLSLRVVIGQKDLEVVICISTRKINGDWTEPELLPKEVNSRFGIHLH